MVLLCLWWRASTNWCLCVILWLLTKPGVLLSWCTVWSSDFVTVEWFLEPGAAANSPFSYFSHYSAHRKWSALWELKLQKSQLVTTILRYGELSDFSWKWSVTLVNRKPFHALVGRIDVVLMRAFSGKCLRRSTADSPLCSYPPWALFTYPTDH
jgi:hypothetical protein